jgi:hypothetical protein
MPGPDGSVPADASARPDAGGLPHCDGPTDTCTCGDEIDGVPRCPFGMAPAKVIDPLLGLVHGCCPCSAATCRFATCCGDLACTGFSCGP